MWLADGDSPMFYIVRMSRLIAQISNYFLYGDIGLLRIDFKKLMAIFHRFYGGSSGYIPRKK